jgi:DNA-binding Xre family transcriptional regulator
MPRVKPLGVNPTEQKIVALLYGAMETEGVQKQELAAALGMTPKTLRQRKKDPLDFTVRELQKACRALHIPIDDLRSAITL